MCGPVCACVCLCVSLFFVTVSMFCVCVCLCVPGCVSVCGCVYLRSYCSLFPQVFKGKKPRREQTRGNKRKSQHAESIVLDIKCDLYDHWHFSTTGRRQQGEVTVVSQGKKN